MTSVSHAHVEGLKSGDLDRAIHFLREQFKDARGPLSTRDLVQLGQTQALSSFAVQLAVWHLVREGEIEFTEDWRLRPARHGPAEPLTAKPKP